MATIPYLWFALFILIGLFVIAKFLSSSSSNEHISGMQIKSGLRGLDPGDYSYFHGLDLPLPDGKSSINIDHVVVSPYGIFVIETMDSYGLLAGTENRSLWTKLIQRHRRVTPNPMDSVVSKVSALIDFLDLPIEVFRPLAYIIGGTQQNSEMPDNVISHDLIPWIRKHGTTIINTSCVAHATSRLDQLSRHTRPATAERYRLTVLTPRRAS